MLPRFTEVLEVIVRRVFRPYSQPFGPLPPGVLAYGDAATDVSVTEKTAVAGLGLWILGGVLTHVAIRVVDRWLFKEKR